VFSEITVGGSGKEGSTASVPSPDVVVAEVLFVVDVAVAELAWPDCPQAVGTNSARDTATPSTNDLVMHL
jgi:hypothetical protein